MKKIGTVALMAATIHAARAAAPTDQTAYERVAEEAWALYDAVDKQAAARHSRR
jgi:hypothetical protein